MKTEGYGMEAARLLSTGDFHPALEDALLEHLAERIASSSLAPLPVVVPTNFLGNRLSHLLAERTGGHINVRFMTLREVASSVVTTPLPGGRSLLPSRGDAVIVRRLLDEGAADGGYFGPVADRPGLSAAIVASIRDLKEASYDPGSFEETARAQGLLRRSRGSKLAELCRIWRAYERRLEEGGWVDDADLLRLAAEAIESGSRTLDRVTVYGFYDLNALQKRLLGAQVAASGATVFFPYSDAPAYAYARATLDWFASLGFTRRELGSDTRDVPLPPETVILSAPGEAREAREATRRLVGILRERDLAVQDVAVLARSLDAYSDLFEAEFDGMLAPDSPDKAGSARGGFAERPRPLARTRSGRGLLKLAFAVRDDFARGDVVEFLSLADLRPGALGGARASVSDWNAVSIAAGVTSGREAWTEGLGGLADRLDGSDADDPFTEKHGHLRPSLEALRSVMERLLDALSPMPARSTVTGYLDKLCAAFRDVTSPGEERDVVLAAAERMREIDCVAGNVSFAYFVELLQGYLTAHARRRTGFGTSGPSILSLMSARGLSYRVVVVPGLVEREFPLRRRQDPILLDTDRERLNAGRGDDPLRELGLRAEATSEERLLFRLAVASATDVLVLTYPRLDPATARPRLPSAFVLDALREITGTPHDYEALEVSEHITRIPLSRRFPRRRAESLTREEFDGCSILDALASGDPGAVAHLLTDDGPLRARLEMEETRWGNPFFTRYDGALGSSEALAAARTLCGFTEKGPAAGRVVSATMLEEYAACPFRFLMHRVLGVDPLDEPEDVFELSPLDRGSLYHAVLERFLKSLRASGDLPLRPESRRELFAVADGLTRSGPWGLSGYPGARRLEFGSLAVNLAVWLSAELLEGDAFVPSYFETRFGGRARAHDDSELSTEASVPFDAAGGIGVEFGGKIDRIDVSADGSRARVIDYKTGRPSSRRPVLDKGRRLQLPVYVIAARRMLSGPPREAAVESAEYRYVGAGPSARPLRLTASELDERTDDLRAAIGLIVKGITSGMFFPYPQDPACSNCDYVEACGTTALALAGMKNGDRRASFFTQGLAEIE